MLHITIFQSRCWYGTEIYSLQFFWLFKKEQKIFQFQFPFFILLIIVFLLLRRKVTRNQMESFTVIDKNTESLSLDLRPVGDAILKSKDTWHYLSFFFDKKHSFWYHIWYYTNKALSTIKSMKMLSNSTRGLSPMYKCLLYRTCILSIALYGFQLWYFKGAPLYQSLKKLKKKCKEEQPYES